MGQPGSWQFDRVAGPFAFIEGTVWTGKSLLFTDIPGDTVLRYDPQHGTTELWRSGTNEANGLALDGQGR